MQYILTQQNNQDSKWDYFGTPFFLVSYQWVDSFSELISIFDQEHCLDVFESTKSHSFSRKVSRLPKINFQLMSLFLFSIYDLTGIKAAIW